MSFFRRHYWLALLPVALVLYVARIGDPPTYVYDEVYHAPTAHRYVLGDKNAWNPRATRADMESFTKDDMAEHVAYEWLHPPFAKLVMAACIWMFGFDSFSYRVGAAWFGVLLLLAFGILAERIRGPAFALFAVAVLGLDGMVFVMSRIAMNDIYLTAFLVAAIAAMRELWIRKDAPLSWLFASGALFGMALATKWSPLGLWAGCSVLVAGRLIQLGNARRLGWFLIAWGVVPVTIYFAAYTPYFALGYGWDDFVTLHKEIIYYQSHLTATHTQASRWYTWPFLGKPVWFYAKYDTGGEIGFIRTIYAMGNPMIWFLLIPGVAIACIRYLRTRSPDDALILVGFFGMWLPWMFVGRITFLQHFLPALPFGVLAVVTMFDDLAKKLKITWLPLAYVCACLVMFGHFYPILSGLSVDRNLYNGHKWFWSDKWRN